jgi:hypothetical protein
MSRKESVRDNMVSGAIGVAQLALLILAFLAVPLVGPLIWIANATFEWTSSFNPPAIVLSASIVLPVTVVIVMYGAFFFYLSNLIVRLTGVAYYLVSGYFLFTQFIKLDPLIGGLLIFGFSIAGWFVFGLVQVWTLRIVEYMKTKLTSYTTETKESSESAVSIVDSDQTGGSAPLPKKTSISKTSRILSRKSHGL